MANSVEIVGSTSVVVSGPHTTAEQHNFHAEDCRLVEDSL